MIVTSTAAIATGKYPPWANFSRLLRKNSRSTARIGGRRAATFQGRQPQR